MGSFIFQVKKSRYSFGAKQPRWSFLISHLFFSTIFTRYISQGRKQDEMRKTTSAVSMRVGQDPMVTSNPMLILIKEEFAVKFLNDPEAVWGINYPKKAMDPSCTPRPAPHSLASHPSS
jgi:hypothetical protein